jgi:hypothetical protein
MNFYSPIQLLDWTWVTSLVVIGIGSAIALLAMRPAFKQ